MNLAGLALVPLLLAAPTPAAPAPTSWRPLAPGIEYGVLSIPATPVAGGDGRLHVVRIDPARARLRAHMSSEPGEHLRTAGAWCDDKRLVAAINLGMYQDDHRSNVGFARKGAHLNNPRFNEYRAYLAFGARAAGLPPAVMIDGEEPRARERLADYDVAVQNLRLARAHGVGVWAQQERRWSEAAIAADRQGRILFLFTRTPLTMWELNNLLARSSLGIDKAMHVEGGPEASLSIRAPGLKLDLNGSYETGFREDDGETKQWSIPNVIGVAAE